MLGLFAPCGVIGRALIVYLGLHTLYIAYVGGDFFPGHRFFVPQIPLFAVACGLALSGAAALLKRVSSRARSVASAPRARVWATVIGLGASVPLLYLLFDTGQTYGPLQGEIYQFREDQRGRRDLMRWLALNKTANASLATGGIGAAGFHGEMPRVIDMVGILDPVVAHRPVANFGKGQAGHEKWATLSEILEKKPTYIEMGYLHPDFWGLGYYMDASMRLDLARRVEGVWRRDALLETGRYLQDTAISFHTAPYPEWVASGSAFENWPAEYRTAARGYALGTVAAHIDTFEASKGNEATGKLTSAPILLAGDKMVLRVGGTFDPEHLHVSLWVDGQRVFTETGLDSDHLSRREWLIGMYRGKHARLEIVDDSVFGHLIVDEVIQWLPAGS